MGLFGVGTFCHTLFLWVCFFQCVIIVSACVTSLRAYFTDIKMVLSESAVQYT